MEKGRNVSGSEKKKKKARGRRPKVVWKSRMPREVIENAQRAGAAAKKLPGEELWHLECVFGDEAYRVVNNWVAGLPEDTDPNVLVQFAPSLSMAGTALCPDLVTGINILREASAVVFHYAPLHREDFNGGQFPAIPGPFQVPLGATQIHQATIALHALFCRIQNLNDPNYPFISNLPSGSYICTVFIQWSNVGQSTAVFKP
jgi:hypothetical protein